NDFNAELNITTADSCAGVPLPSTRCAWFAPRILGFDVANDRVAAVTVRERASAGEGCDDDAGEVFDLATWKVVSSKKWSGSSNCRDRNQTINEFAREIGRKGFVPARNLVTHLVLEPAGSELSARIAILDAPLCGYMVEAKPVGRHF